MAKYIAEIQDASGNTVYPATQWGAITNPPAIPNMGDYYKKSEIDKALQGTFITYPGISGYAGDVKVLVVGNKATAWLFGKIPKNGGTKICYLPKNIIPKTDYYKTLLFRTIPSQSLVLKINSADGALEVVASTNDIDMLTDEFTWTIGEVYA